MQENADERRERLAGQLPEWYRPVLEERDAETAFMLGSYHVLHHGPVHSGFARAWFAVAASNAPVDMAWRIADEYCHWGSAHLANWWMRYAIITEYGNRSDEIAIDPKVFALTLDESGANGQDFSVQVVSADNALAEMALSAAEHRFRLVTADGRELADYEELQRVLADGGDGDPRNYTPNSVSGPVPAEAGPAMYCDCMDGTMPLMARTMIRILIEEVHAVGLHSCELRPMP